MTGSKKWMLAIGAAVLAATCAVAREPGPPPPPPPPPGEGPGGIEFMSRALNLNDDQKLRILNINEKYMEGSLGDALDAMRAAREALGAAIHDETATDDQVQEKAAAVGELETRIAVERHHLMAEIQQVLTPAQRKRAAQLALDRANRLPPPPPPPMDPGGR